MKLILSCPLIFALLLFGQGVQIYLPEYNQKVKIDGIEVLGETSNSSDILWKIIVENSPFTTITKSLEMGGLEVSPFPIFNSSFGGNVIVAHAWGPPQVISTDPADSASEVDVSSPITITFSKEMDQSTVNSGTVLFAPALVGGFTTQWSGDDKTVTLVLNNPQQDLKFYTNYTVTLTDRVKDKDGVQLDFHKF